LGHHDVPDGIFKEDREDRQEDVNDFKPDIQDHEKEESHKEKEEDQRGRDSQTIEEAIARHEKGGKEGQKKNKAARCKP